MANAKIKTSELTIKDSPSTSATLVGVDNGETVQIPSSVFARKSELFSKNYNDLTNKPTIPSAYSHPSTHPASMITGLATVATSGSYNDLKDKPTIPSGGGGGASIIDIEEFPSNPSTTAIYRKWQVIKAEFRYGTVLNPDMTCIVVDTLPAEGNMAYDGVSVIAYYQRTDGGIYGYVDSVLSGMTSIPVGWYPATMLFDALGYSFGGVITSLDEATQSNTFYALVTKKPHLYCFHNNGSAVEKSAIITNDNYEFDEATGTLTQHIIL